jgi:hypothetical protein
MTMLSFSGTDIPLGPARSGRVSQRGLKSMALTDIKPNCLLRLHAYCDEYDPQ